jgi:hypothetical protein
MIDLLKSQNCNWRAERIFYQNEPIEINFEPYKTLMLKMTY